MKKIIGLTLTALTLIVFVLTIVFVITATRAAANNDIVKFFGYSYSVVGSGSMAGDQEGSLDIGDIIIMKETDFDDAEIGDVIVFRSLDEPIMVVHRIIGEDEDGNYITRGDANTSDDDNPVSAENYFGSVVLSFGAFGFGEFILNSRSLIFGLIILVFTAILISEVVRIIKQMKEKDEGEYQEKLKTEREKLLEQEKEHLRKELSEKRPDKDEETV